MTAIKRMSALDGINPDLPDVAVGAPSTLSAFVNSGVTAAGTYVAPTPAASVATPPQRFQITNRYTTDITLSIPNPVGTVLSLTVMAGETITFRQVSTSGYINESGNKPRAQLDLRYGVIGLTEASNATPAPPGTGMQNQYRLTALAATAAFAAPTTPVMGEGARLLIRIKDNGTARALTWNAIYRSTLATLPPTTVANKLTYVGLIYNAVDAVWDCISVGTQA